MHQTMGDVCERGDKASRCVRFASGKKLPLDLKLDGPKGPSVSEVKDPCRTESLTTVDKSVATYFADRASSLLCL